MPQSNLTEDLSSVSSLAPSTVAATARGIHATTELDDVAAVGIGVTTGGDLPGELGLDWDGLEAAGFTGAAGQALPIPGTRDPLQVLVGVGDDADVSADDLRDAAAHFARATERHSRLAIMLPHLSSVAPATAAQAVVEGALLARYRYEVLKSSTSVEPITHLAVVVSQDRLDAVAVGARRGGATAAATMLARDLANAPPSLLTAERMAAVATALGPACGVDVEVFDRDQLVELECGGLLGVNAGSVHPPRMVVLRYLPRDDDGNEVAPAGHIGMVGKGIMYDSGGLALKPGDATHANMKNDMSGAAAILAAMMALAEVGCPAAVTGWLMCTDNMPSGSATAMGDVLRIRGGTTVEVANTDAEGRLVMADALVLATEEPVDAIVDMATLTGACMRALGTLVAGVMGTDPALVDQVEQAAVVAGEPVWELPLERRYRSQLDSEVADIKNLGGANAGAITAGLFLAEFVGDIPFAHVDIAGVAQNERDTAWRPPGNTGFGARLLVELATGFAPPSG